MTQQESKRKIAVIYSSSPKSGGAASYEGALSRIVQEINGKNLDFSVTEYFPHDGPKSKLPKGDGTQKYYKYTVFDLLFLACANSLATRRFLSKFPFIRTRLESQLSRSSIHLAYFASPNPLAMAFTAIPFISTVWDFGHRNQPGFPEVSAHSRWEARESFYRSTLPKSVHIFTDSDQTGEDLQKFYGIGRSKWTNIGLLPQNLEVNGEVKDISGSRYFIYPAQAWPHKNHVTIIKALSLLADEEPNISLVFTGADKGNSGHILNTAKSLGLENRVKHLGFVSEDHLSNLISNAIALLMPTLIGPTNIPPLDALSLGTPAIVSDVHVFDDDVQGQLTIVPALDERAWASAMKDCLTRPRPKPHRHNSQIVVERIETTLSREARFTELWSPDFKLHR